MNSLFVRMSRKALPGALAAVLVAAAMLAPAGVAQAAAGLFEWCPSPAGHDDAACEAGTSFQDAVLKAQAAHAPGTIFVNSGTFTENITASGLQNVTFQGSANGGAGTMLDGYLWIFNSKNIIVIGLIVTDGISVDGGKGAYQIVGSSGTLSIKNSKFDKNPAGSGLIVSHYGNVSLENVSASQNRDSGINVSTSGNIVAMDIKASKNGALGCSLGGSGTVTVSAVKLKTNRFDRNGAEGLHVSNAKAVTLVDISAGKNGTTGLAVSSAETIKVSAVRSKANRFDGNVDLGMDVGSPKNITLTDVSASKNGAGGLNVSSGGMILVDASKSKMNKFDRNGGFGMYVTASGRALVIDSSASKNKVDGLRIGGNMVAVGTNRSKSVRFDRNTGYGIYATSPDLMLVTDTNASRNGKDGLFLNSGGGIAVYTIRSKSIRFEKNRGYGLYASSDGTIAIGDVIVNRNGFDGAYLSSIIDVVVTTTHSKGNQFSRNTNAGLAVTANGSITLSDISALKNGLDGVQASGATVTVNTLHAKTNKFDNNTLNGLLAAANGVITITRSSASKNHASGMLLKTGDDNASITCSAARKNTDFDIRASLGSGNLTLSSVQLTHSGLVDINFLGSGTITVNTVGCS